jgi:hypothetical protein
MAAAFPGVHRCLKNRKIRKKMVDDASKSIVVADEVWIGKQLKSGLKTL